MRTESDPRGEREAEVGRSRRRRAFAAASLSSLLPGAGQLYLGRWRRAAASLLLAALCLAGAAVAWQRRAGLASLLLRPSWLVALLVADAVLLAFRLWSVVDAYRFGAGGASTAPARWRQAAVAAGLALVLAATVAPHAVIGYYDFQAYDLLTSVFHRTPRLVASPLSHPGGSTAAAARPERVTVLLIGGDAGPGRIGLRADTMIVVSVQPASGEITMFGLPRNLVRVPLPDGPDRAFHCRCFPRPLNELYAYAQEHPSLFPGDANPGVNALQGAAERLLGIPIDYHALVDLKGFVDMVDALGGVTIQITEPIYVEIDKLGAGPGGPAFNLQPGRRHLNGLTALAYVRSRKTTSDYDRMRRQRCLLGALVRQTDTRRMLRAFPRLVRVAKRDLSTDVPLDLVPSLIGATSQHRPHVEAVGFTPPGYIRGWAAGYPIPDVPHIRRAVRAALRGQVAAAATGAGKSRHGATGSGAAAATRAPLVRQAPDPCRGLG